MIGLDLEGIEELRGVLQRVGSRKAHATAMEAVAGYVLERLKAYPKARHGPMPGFPKSEKQRRYVMMLVRQGKIPYRRTGHLRRGWKIEKWRGIDQLLVNEVEYAPFVQGSADEQALYHAITGWPTIESETGGTTAYNARRIYTRVIEEFMRGGG